MDLIHGIDTDRVRQIILTNMLAILADFGVVPICEGIEALAELAIVQDPAFASCRTTYSPVPSSTVRWRSGRPDDA